MGIKGKVLEAPFKYGKTYYRRRWARNSISAKLKNGIWAGTRAGEEVRAKAFDKVKKLTNSTSV
jgi:hypothetical protein